MIRERENVPRTQGDAVHGCRIDIAAADKGEDGERDGAEGPEPRNAVDQDFEYDSADDTEVANEVAPALIAPSFAEIDQADGERNTHHEEHGCKDDVEHREANVVSLVGRVLVVLLQRRVLETQRKLADNVVERRRCEHPAII